MALRKSLLFVLALLGCATTPLQAQSLPNIDWETGTYANWLYYTGTCCVAGVMSTPSGTSAVSGRHTLTSGTATDPYGGFPILSPWGGGNSLRVGNDINGGEAERCRYYVRIPTGTTSYSLIYHYAVVLNDPSHSVNDQPRMEIKAYDSTTGMIIPCDSFNYVVRSSIPGFLTSSISAYGSPVRYMPWKMGNFKLNGLGGRTIAIDIATGDCAPTGHFGYGYVDMTGGLFANTIHTTCGSSTILLSGPEGYSAYSWRDSATFSTVYGTTRDVTVSIPGAPTTYAVILTPHAGYGCPDTLYTRAIPLLPCAGTPPTGTAYAYRGIGCGVADTLKMQGLASWCGITFQWQSSPDNATWSNISGATTAVYSFYHPYSSLHYRCAARCTASGITTSSSSVFVPSVSGPAMYTVSDPPDTVCNGANFYVSTCGASTAFNVTTWYGDGTSDNTLLTTTGVRHANIFHSYAFPGNYTIKQILYDGTMPVDTTTFSYNYLYCSTIPVKLYTDNNSNCLYDAGDASFYSPMKTEVDSNGIAIDTITTLSGFYYKASGLPGTIYSFKVLPDVHLSPSCPVSGILYDTIVPMVNFYHEKKIGFNCSTASLFDLSVNTSARCGAHAYVGTILVKNTGCALTPAILKMNFTPDFIFAGSSPSPSSLIGTEATWNLGVISAAGIATKTIGFHLESPSLTIGDTVSSMFSVSPTSGDVDISNNIVIRNDTAKSGFDPNYIEVSPQGYITTASTPLQYTIHFENTGNDTAFNIHVMDTISDYLDFNSLEMLTATHRMDLALFRVGSYNIAKFDFPKINLLDSSHHGLCDGMLVYTINTKPGLPLGTIIPNRAGIYFDDNPVVMTNTVNNIIPFPGTLTTHGYDNDNVQIFPNPAYNELTIKMTDDFYQSFTIANQVGQVMVQQQFSGSAVKADISVLPSGLYFVTLRGDNGSKVVKFVKM